MHDVGATQVLSPTGTISRWRCYPLKAEVKNFGNQAESFGTKAKLTPPWGFSFYYNRNVSGLGSGDDCEVTYTRRMYWRSGAWTVKAWTLLATDMNHANDEAYGRFRSQGCQGWGIGFDVPVGEYVNKGAALTTDDGVFYLLKGKKDPTVYRYVEDQDGSMAVSPVPTESRKLGYGTGMVTLNGTLYLLKGNKSFEFYMLDPETGMWTRLADVPAGSGRAPKHGASITVAGGYIYVLKGNKTHEFYRYDPNADAWEGLAEIPGERPVKHGGALCSDGSTVYAFKGNRTTEFWAYDIAGNAWTQLADVPTKRVRKGACMAYADGMVYAVTGYKMQFFGYDVAGSSWAQLEDVPRDPDRRKIKAGASMAALEGSIFLLKGKKTEVVLVYEPVEFDREGIEPQRDGLMAEQTGAQQFLSVSPNPTDGRVRISYAVPSLGPADVTIYTSNGRLVEQLIGSRDGVLFDASGLANGVYLVNVEAGNTTLSKRFIVQH
jgi:hypothetical protein